MLLMSVNGKFETRAAVSYWPCLYPKKGCREVEFMAGSGAEVTLSKPAFTRIILPLLIM